jgi:tetratricopeptide (TPR) repeat protein
MAEQDWFRKTSWNKSDQGDFWAHWKRARGASTKAQYLRIQALYLSDQYQAASLEMLDKMLREFPDSHDVAGAELQRGQIFLRQGKLKEAIDALERALAREAAFPNSLTDAWSVYGMSIIHYKLVEHYDVAGQLAEARLAQAAFPIERFLGNAILAVVSRHRGNSNKASEHARAALQETKVEHSGFRYHPDIGLVENPDEKLVAELKAIARL